MDTQYLGGHCSTPTVLEAFKPYIDLNTYDIVWAHLIAYIAIVFFNPFCCKRNIKIKTSCTVNNNIMGYTRTHVYIYIYTQ